MKKVLMWRQVGSEDWTVYDDDSEIMELDDYEVGKVYTYEYKVIEREAK